VFNRYLHKVNRDQRGITGLETAIILIAFVVVASVFAYTVLSAGLFSTQKSAEAVYSGLKGAQSTLDLRGGVIATANTTGGAGTGNIKQLTFTVNNALGGEPIDFTTPTADNHTGLAAAGSKNSVVISYIDSHQRVDDLYWTFTPIGANDGTNMLSQNEKFQITIGSATAGTGAGNLMDALSTALSTNTQFTIEVKTANGAVLDLQRTTPSYIDTIVNLN